MIKDYYCPNFRASVTTNDDKGNILIYRPRCKKWDCPYCAVQNAKLWRYRLMLECEKTTQNVWFFWTITLDAPDHKTESPHIHSLQVWRDNWDKLMKRIRRDMKPYSKKIRYVRVFETHKSGVLHVHMLTDIAYNDIKEVQQWNSHTRDFDIVWRSDSLAGHLSELGLGDIHDVRPIITENEVDNGVARNVSAYVTKYLTKDIQSDVRRLLKDGGMGRVRMIQTSQKFGEVPKFEGEFDWRLGGVHKIVHDALPLGNFAKDISRDVVVDDSDFYNFDMYPNRDSDNAWVADIIENFEES